LIIAAALAISAVSYMLLLRLHEEEVEEKVLSESEVVGMIKEDPGDRRLGVLPGTVEILTAELMDFEQLPENERRFIGQWDVSKREYVSGGHEKVWVVVYECVGSESGPGMVIYSGKMRVRRVLDAFTGERLLRQVLNLSFETISRSIDYIRYENHECLVIENSEEWERIWSLAKPERPPPPVIDFSTHLGIAVFMGGRATGGYEILIEQIIDAENEIIVDVKETYPGRGIIVTDAFTSPHHIIKVERVQKPIVFEVQQFLTHAWDENQNPYDEIMYELVGEYRVDPGSGPPEPSI